MPRPKAPLLIQKNIKGTLLISLSLHVAFRRRLTLRLSTPPFLRLLSAASPSPRLDSAESLVAPSSSPGFRQGELLLSPFLWEFPRLVACCFPFSFSVWQGLLIAGGSSLRRPRKGGHFTSVFFLLPPQTSGPVPYRHSILNLGAEEERTGARSGRRIVADWGREGGGGRSV